MAKAKTAGTEATNSDLPTITPTSSDQVETLADGEPLPDVVDTPSPDLALDASEPEALPELVKARVLAASAYGQPNDVIEIDATLAKAIPDVVDTSPEAVAYAESLAFEQ
ncbi:hypothetical protein ACFOY5_10735 [Massilia aurea]|jgi:hypothetical protein|uniref:hypothetical protein n=1 Tax=Massilia aurea TaxID=373040 RepID=UPI0021611884|nr:hypothetical protein [Massilia aurea]MCS0709467.1 hypothetical protein [Massilia aurea]